MAHVNFKFLHLAFKIVSSAIIFSFLLERSENSQLQIPNEQRTVQHLLKSARTTAERDTIIFLKKRQAVVFVSSFHPRGGVFCCSWRDGAVCFFFEAGRGGVFFSEAGRGGCLFFSRRDGVAFFFFSTGRDGAVFVFFRGPGRNGCFWRGQFFRRDGAKSLHRPAKGGLNRPSSRPCKALNFSNQLLLRKRFLRKKVFRKRFFSVPL